MGTNPIAEAAFAALGGVDAAIDHVRIGSLPGTAASLPAALLRSRRIRLTGSGAGSVSKVRMIAEVPEIARFGDGTFDAPYAVCRLNRVGEAGRTRSGPAPSSRTAWDRFEECGGRHRARRASVDG
ncbi:hypothetical protein [Lentzea sp.]|uniref:hypothetical protein n=1 Tax=Lentzea sp. TaxID=56099 RepID=UPI002C03DF7E|nr:hypothetical protein [Lentzea sp.]HUQ58408.1 hypothetical protein [Lentzea sp.]